LKHQKVEPNNEGLMDLTMIEIFSSYSSVEVYLVTKKSINIKHMMKRQKQPSRGLETIN